MGALTKKSLFISIALVLGCGDSKTPRDLQNTRLREQAAERLAELQPLVGEYEGTLKDARSGEKLYFEMSVLLSGEPFNNNGIPGEVNAPTISAGVRYYEYGKSGVYVPVTFDRSDYDAKTKKLNFFSDDKKNSIISDVTPDRIVGRWTNALRGVIGDFDVSKIRP